MQTHLKKTRAAEVKVVRHKADLVQPPDLERFRAQEVSVDG